MTDHGKSNDIRVRVAPCPATFGARPGGGDEVLAWVVDLARPPVAPEVLFERLTADEQARATRYKIAKAREQFVIGRGLLRTLLGCCLGCEFRDVPLNYLPSGKPVLGGALEFHFNLTHTDGVAVIALARQPVGVDV
ncbi:MAG: hypothetical protein K2V38_06405, partial [Gemmataceae bacterium]|nr:hypothetical protein [Gemmataceae bacterium]